MTLSTQFMTMLAMIGMGAFFGAALDTYNRFLQRKKRKSWLVFINDILFWLFQGLFIFFVLFHVNQGELRFYIFLALLCGFASYQSILKQVYLKCLEKLISIVIAIFRFFVKLVRLLVYKPIQILISVLVSTIMMIGKSLLFLLKGSIRCILSITRVLCMPIMWILLLFWKLLPKGLKKFVEKLYNKLAGNFEIVKNNIIKWVRSRKNDHK
jgi:spore cortex biosynthesis protein YabQ